MQLPLEGNDTEKMQDEKDAHLGSYTQTSACSDFKEQMINSGGKATTGPGIRPPLAKVLTTRPRRPTPVQGNHAGTAPEETSWGAHMPPD